MTTLTLPRRRERAKSRGYQIAEKLADAAAWVIGPVWRRRAFLPGLGGAAGVSCGIGVIVGHVWGHGLTPWVTLLVASVFALRLDGQIKLGPRGDGQ